MISSSKPAGSARLTVLSAFTGAGGLDLGLAAAGFKTIACIERDAFARATIAANRPDWKLEDARDIIDAAKILVPKRLGLRARELDLIAGGPPCQPFSKAAQWADSGRGGLNDPRSKSLSAFLRLVESFLPKVVLIENVEGFCRGKTSALPMLEVALNGINKRCKTAYSLHHFVVDAADFGVAQHRKRAIVLACRDGEIVPAPSPTTATDETRIRSFDALFGLRCKKLPSMRGRWAELLPTIPEGCNYQHHTARGGGLPIFGFRTRFWSFLLKLAQDRPAWTISAQPGPATGPFHWTNRPLTTPELLRLQSFPANWKISGGRVAQVRQVGNATPPLLAEVIGRQIAIHVFQASYSGALHLRIRRRRVTPVASAVKKVPKQFRPSVRTAPKDHPGKGQGPGAVARNKRLALKKRRLAIAAKRQRAAARVQPSAKATKASKQSGQPPRRSKISVSTHKHAVGRKQSRRLKLDRAERRFPKRGSPSTRAA